MLIEENAIYTRDQVQELLGCGEGTVDKIFALGKAYREPKTNLILGSNLIDYIKQQSK